MKNIIPPEPSLGEIKYDNEIFNISETQLAIEKIDSIDLLHISVIASHHEMHNESKVYVGDLNFTLLMPFDPKLLKESIKITFPTSDSNHPEWEKTIYSSFSRFEHLLILNSNIIINSKNEKYTINITGEVGEGISSNHRGFKFESNFTAEKSDIIDRGKYYFLR